MGNITQQAEDTGEYEKGEKTLKSAYIAMHHSQSGCCHCHFLLPSCAMAGINKPDQVCVT